MKEIISRKIEENGPYPNNPKLPLLIYKGALEELSPAKIQALFTANGWRQAWVNGIYPFHHFHSNVHEILGVSSGSCEVQIGGEDGEIFKVEAGDVLILPAGTAHKNLRSTSDFTCVGAYSSDIPYDMHHGKKEEVSSVVQRIAKVALPNADPVFGREGPLFEYWEIY